jgi:hypothetical protein
VIPLNNPVAATRQSAANFMVSRKECGAQFSRKTAQKAQNINPEKAI